MRLGGHFQEYCGDEWLSLDGTLAMQGCRAFVALVHPRPLQHQRRVRVESTVTGSKRTIVADLSIMRSAECDLWILMVQQPQRQCSELCQRIDPY